MNFFHSNDSKCFQDWNIIHSILFRFIFFFSYPYTPVSLSSISPNKLVNVFKAVKEKLRLFSDVNFSRIFFTSFPSMFCSVGPHASVLLFVMLVIVNSFYWISLLTPSLKCPLVTIWKVNFDTKSWKIWHLIVRRGKKVSLRFSTKQVL